MERQGANVCRLGGERLGTEMALGPTEPAVNHRTVLVSQELEHWLLLDAWHCA